MSLEQSDATAVADPASDSQWRRTPASPDEGRMLRASAGVMGSSRARSVMPMNGGRRDEAIITYPGDAYYQVDPKTGFPGFLNRDGGWKHNAEITEILEGRRQPPSSVEEALTLVSERFGCAYRFLIDVYKRDPTIIMEATVRSAGHNLEHVPPDVLAALPPSFFVEAVRRGARGWILHYASESVKDDLQAVIVCVRDCPEAIEYAMPRMKEHPDVKAVLPQPKPRTKSESNAERCV